MNASEPPLDYRLDVRHVPPDKVSLDLSRHLSLRASLGPVAIIAERPLVLLSVVKKRWTRIVHEVERQYASTLDRPKKQELKRELLRLQTYRFSANSLKQVPIDILFLASGQLLPDTTYSTIYLTPPIEQEHLLYIVSHLEAGGTLVMYKNDS